MLLFYQTWYTEIQYPKYQRPFFSHIGGIFVRFSVGGETGEGGFLIVLGYFLLMTDKKLIQFANVKNKENELFLFHSLIFSSFLGLFFSKTMDTY
jgi:hypothetical protein